MVRLVDSLYIEKDTGRRVCAHKSIVFDSIFWIIDYTDEPPVNYVFSDSEFERLFQKGD